MANLFKKAAVMTDLHIGLKSNSVSHNEDCLSFVEWFVTTAKINNCDTAIICGDWHNHRASINIHSLHYSMKCLELLNNNFGQVFFLTGNHDLYYRDRRDIESVSWGGYLPNIHIVNDIFTEGDVTICPWLVGDEIEQVKKIKSTYTFGHFELPNFYMNAQVLMPEHNGGITASDLSNTGTAFSGHFHKRQTKKNITYIGNAFPHNYADAGDDDRGLTTLEWGQEPVYHAWPDQPRYRVLGLSTLIDNAANLLMPKMNVRVNLDIEISYEEANYIKETFVSQYNLREMSLIPNKSAGVAEDLAPGDVRFESVDQIVIDQITNIDSEFYDSKLLLQIYQNL
jgi:DNA repair exonuclease SbcCD nuclease subunit